MNVSINLGHSHTYTPPPHTHTLHTHNTHTCIHGTFMQAYMHTTHRHMNKIQELLLLKDKRKQMFERYQENPNTL